MDIHLPSTPRHLAITQTMIEDFIVNPVLAAELIFGEVMDEFQKVRLIHYCWVPFVMDTSGFSSAKTRTLWLAINLRCMLIPDHVAGVYYQNFNAGQKSFWGYYDTFMRRSPIFRAQIGRMAADMSETEGKGTTKGASCWNCHYKNASHVMLPAPGFITDAASQASIRFNDLAVDEWTKIDATGSEGIDDQLIGRSSRASYNQYHPFWGNHHIFPATAEDTMHPANARYQVFSKEVRSGNPDYAILSYSFKDISDLPSYSGKSFKDELRIEKLLATMKAKFSGRGSKYRQEVLGLWSKSGVGWYTGEALDACVDLGKSRGLRPMVSRRDDPNDSDNVRYFLGVDVAKGDRAKSDDGALVALRAEPIVEHPGDRVGDYRLDLVWAYKVRRADAAQWAALIHLKDRHFKWAGICLDHGGGGQWVAPELAKRKQIINDVETTVIPICQPHDTSVAIGNYILIMFSHGDDQIKTKWETLKGYDGLKDAAHSELREAIEHAAIGFPPPIGEIPKEEVKQWPEERVWASRLLEQARTQLASISVAVDNDGKFLITRNGARQFSSGGKKDDFAYATLQAYTRFLVWLKCNEQSWSLPDDEVCGGGLV